MSRKSGAGELASVIILVMALCCSSIIGAGGFFWYVHCDRHTNEEDCEDMTMCQWDKNAYRPRCISIDDDITKD